MWVQYLYCPTMLPINSEINQELSLSLNEYTGEPYAYNDLSITQQ